MERNRGILATLSLVIAITGLTAAGQKPSRDVLRTFNSISRAEMELLLTDVAKTNPKILENLANDPEMRKQQIESIKELLAFASQAQREGLASTPSARQELENIRAEILAVNYDRELNKGKPARAPFGYITEAQVAAYWAGDGARSGTQRMHEAEFNDFLDAKVEFLRANDPKMKDRAITDDEKTAARDVFAKTRIYKAEYEQKGKAGTLPRAFTEKANLQVKLQQAQFLARLYAEKIVDMTKATDVEIEKYLNEHPELDTAARKAKAEGILKRAVAGEDFAALANEFTEDPGNQNQGVKHGGLYKDVSIGTMVAPFERAALALEPGQVAPALVESDFGYHIIKLEKKVASRDQAGKPTQTYDVRHILIATTMEDQVDENGRNLPVKDYVRKLIETEREKQLIDKAVVENNIQVPDDFTVPVAAADEKPATLKKAPVRKKRPVKKSR